MQKLTFTTTINATKEKIWGVLFDDATYRQWTSVFHEGSFAETDWKEGSKALFITPERDGMVSRIVTHRPNEFLSILHLGVVKKGVEDTESEEVKGWAGAHENYTLSGTDGAATLTVDMDITDEYKGYFEKTWPQALDHVKELAES